MSDKKLKKITLDEFKRKPVIYISEASDVHRDNRYSLFITASSGEDITVILTSSFELNTKADQEQNFNLYKKNPKALGNAIDRAFKSAADGKVVSLKIQDYSGGNSTAFIFCAK